MAKSGKLTRRKVSAQSAIDKLMEVPTGVVTDALTRLGIGGWMEGVLPARSDARAVGFATTVRFGPRRGVNHLQRNLYEIIRTLEAGQILVMEAHNTGTSVFGGNIANQGRVQGLAAMITDGHCRDFGEMRQLEMPVFCRGPTIRLPHEIELVAQDVPVTCGGAQVIPGDIVMGDCDGVVVIPGGEIKSILHQVAELVGLEAELEQAVKRRASLKTINAVLKRKKALRK